MRETPAAFARRTGTRYAPPPTLLSALPPGGRPLRPREACPTLFRYPGPRGLAGLLDGRRGRLAPPEAPGTWLSVRPGAAGRGPELFGAVALLEPLRLHPCLAPDAAGGPDAYLGLNAALGEGEGAVWVPPSAFGRRVAWDRLLTADEVRRRLGRDLAKERGAVRDALGAYLEEMDQLSRAGLPPLPKAWHDVGRARRRSLLASCGAVGRWTR